jgi:signal transduction histidine kinase
MSYDPYDDAMANYADQVLKDRSVEGAQYYLGTYGDAVEARVSRLLAQARALLAVGFAAPALISATTAIEITVRFMLVRPLVQGAFLSDEWAELLAARIGTGRTDEDRKILPALLKQWSLDINTVLLASGSRLWEVITKQVLPKRHAVVHAGAKAETADVEAAIECVERLLADVVHPIGKTLGLTVQRTGKWCEIHGVKEHESSGTQWWSSFTPRRACIVRARRRDRRQKLTGETDARATSELRML